LFVLRLPPSPTLRSLHGALPIFLLRDLGKPHGTCARSRPLLGRLGRRLRCGARGLLLQRVPCAAPRALAHPARRLIPARAAHIQDRKSTRLNSSHVSISYAVFCL